MLHDKEKLLRVMRSLDADYEQGKISEEKYRYFRSKYEDKLNALDARDATDRIRSMQGKPSDKRTAPKPSRLNKKEEEKDLVQKYIINPKKDDESFNKGKPPMDKGTFRLVAVLVLIIGFTVGIGYGVLTFDFGSISVSDAQAIVEDTAFPEVQEVSVNNTTNTSVQTGETYTSDTSYSSSGDTYSSQSYDSSSSSSDSGSSSSSSSSYDSSTSGSSSSSSSGSSSSTPSSSSSSGSDSGSSSSESTSG